MTKIAATQTTEEYAAEIETHKTVELRKIARSAGFKTVGADATPVNKGRKADLIAALVGKYADEYTEQQNRKAASTGRDFPKSHSSRKQMCRECGKRKIHFGTQGRDSTMCVPCFEYAGFENQHNDDAHSADAKPQSDLWDKMAECPICEKEEIGPFAKTPAGKNLVHKKALRFEADAKAAGWTALARNGSENGVSLVTARRGDEELTIIWDNGACRNTGTTHKGPDGKVRKVRNASAARKILAS
jgi:hypothetical protein